MNNLHTFIKNFFQTGKQLNFQMWRSYSSVKEKRLKINDATINYVQVGNGDKSILCFPGALGTIWSDFKPQIDHLDKSQFTIVAFDPPGYGLSRPPARNFDINFYKTDAQYAYDLMKKLNIDKFSLLGWSDGGISSMILASQHPEAVESLIVWGANAYLLPEDVEAYESIRDTRNWSAKAREPLVKLYGDNGLQSMWTDWCDTMNEIKQRNKGNICMDCLGKIKCPTLILHGVLDPMIHSEHPSYLNTHIENSKIHVFPKGKHNIHLRYADEFNAIVTKFILTGKTEH